MDTGLDLTRTKFDTMKKELPVEKESPLGVLLESSRLMDKRLHLHPKHQSNRCWHMATNRVENIAQPLLDMEQNRWDKSESESFASK